jgi:hypothetical protein
LAKNTKGHPPVLNQDQIEKSGDYRKALVQFQLLDNQPFGDLIQEQNREGRTNK